MVARGNNKGGVGKATSTVNLYAGIVCQSSLKSTCFFWSILTRKGQPPCHWTYTAPIYRRGPLKSSFKGCRSGIYSQSFGNGKYHLLELFQPCVLI